MYFREWRFDDCSVGLTDMYKKNFKSLKTRCKGINNESEFADRGLRLDADTPSNITLPRAVSLEPNLPGYFFRNIGLFGI